MKRGLKDQLAAVASSLKCVTTTSPMKRGLKVPARRPRIIQLWHVTIYSPMKRGLKDYMKFWDKDGLQSYNLFPDEKGTERQLSLTHTKERLTRLQSIPR